MTMPPSAPLRPTVAKRKLYEPEWPPERFIVPLLRGRIEDCISKYAKGEKERLALDAGCGRQPFRTFLEQLGFKYTGIDVAQTPEQSVDFVCAIDRPLEPHILRSPGYDFILCTEVLEHTADWRQAFANFVELLRPGGRILITAPQVYPLHEEPYDFWRPTLYAIETYAREAGLAMIYSEKAGDGWDVLGTVISAIHFVPKHGLLRERVLARVVRDLHRLLLWSLHRTEMREWVSASSPWYLSNIAVLEKP